MPSTSGTTITPYDAISTLAQPIRRSPVSRPATWASIAVIATPATESNAIIDVAARSSAAGTRLETSVMPTSNPAQPPSTASQS